MHISIEFGEFWKSYFDKTGLNFFWGVDVEPKYIII